MQRLHGVPASPGATRGALAVIVDAELPTGGRIELAAADAEVARLARTAAAVARSLDVLAAEVAAGGHPDESAIVAAQAAMARDPALVSLAETRIRQGDDAIAAVRAAGADLATQLRSLDDELLAARATDVEDVVSRIAGLLAGLPAERRTLERPSVVVARDLAPSVTAGLPRDQLVGIALEAGSATSHAAILARAYGIPAVVGVPGLLAAAGRLTADPGRVAAFTVTVTVDGDTGDVVLDPDAAERVRIDERIAATATARDLALAEADLAAVTTDGVEVTLLANIGTPDESRPAVALGARGVGLFRTEFLFIERPTAPTEDEQVAAYRSVVEAFAPGPVTIRLLDVGGDKPIPYLPIAPEANPFLGVRALRLASDRPQVFVTQLRAVMRATAPGEHGSGAGRPLGRVKVMAPMVADATDVATLLDLAARAEDSLREDGLPFGHVDLGVMLEIPGAILVADSFFDRLDFASLGTNDLLQYTLAVDRGNRELARYQDSLHPALLRLVAESVAASRRAGIELSVCGEMGGDPLAALALVGLGVRQLSMASSSIAPVRRAIRRASSRELERAAADALRLPSAAAVRELFADLPVPA
ncbi:MAG TPA: phosphoenolpyruvate--protein phosphotransferase [Candidatus Limnocylindrales bacterium]